MVRCSPGQEQEAAVQLMRKAIYQESIGKPLRVGDSFAVESKRAS